MQKAIHRRGAGALLASLLLPGCFETVPLTSPSFVESRDEAAAVLVSVTGVAAWDQVADAVQPNFQLTSQAALEQVAPVTQRIQEHTLNAFGVGLGVGTRRSFSTSTDSTTSTATNATSVADGVSSTTSRTETATTNTQAASREPGVAPDAPTGLPAGAQRPATPAPAGELGLDPILKYQAALSLYQTVQLMNRQVQHAASLGCFVPFLIQMKLAVMPYRRHLPYDVHARVSFFSNGAAPDKPAAADAGSPGGANDTLLSVRKALEEARALAQRAVEATQKPRPLPPVNVPAPGGDCAPGEASSQPFVLPLLVTDDIERTLKGRAVETARQISFALNSMVHGLAANAGLNAVNQQLAAIMGQDLNSRLTVTRQTDNTLYARIGAANQATAGYALVGQTYDVSLLLLVPRSEFTQGKPDPRIDVHVFPQFRNAIDGRELPARPASALLAQTDAAMRDMLGGDDLKRWEKVKPEDRGRFVRKLAGEINNNDWEGFAQALSDKANYAGWDKLEPLNLSRAHQRALWVRLSALIADSPVKTTFFTLKRPADIAIPAQDLPLFDDGKRAAFVQIRDAVGITGRSLSAVVRLKVKGKTDPVLLAAHGLAYEPATGVLTVNFLSPAKLGIGEIEADQSAVELRQRCVGGLCPGFNVPAGFKLAAVVKPAADAATAKFELLAHVRRIVAVKKQGALAIDVDKLPSGETVVLKVGNADLVSATGPKGALAVAKNQVSLAENGRVAFQLDNLSPGTYVTVEAESKQGGKSTGKKSLELSVEAAD